MRESRVFSFLIVCLMFFCVNSAKAQIITFNDTAIYWPNWANTDTTPVIDNNLDTIGVPNFTGGQAVVNNGLLSSLTINRDSGFSSVLSPGDLFIDLGANEIWDYVVDLTNWAISSPGNPDPSSSPSNRDLYSVNLPLGNPNTPGGYILSGQDLTSPWGSYYIRDAHPVAADFANISGETIAGSVSFSGWNGAQYYTFTFPNGGLDLEGSDNFAIGWAPNCANDVIYEKLTPIPEPASMSLLGLGLLGLFGLKRKEKKR